MGASPNPPFSRVGFLPGAVCVCVFTLCTDLTTFPTNNNNALFSSPKSVHPPPSHSLQNQSINFSRNISKGFLSKMRINFLGVLICYAFRSLPPIPPLTIMYKSAAVSQLFIYFSTHTLGLAAFQKFQYFLAIFLFLFLEYFFESFKSFKSKFWFYVFSQLRMPYLPPVMNTFENEAKANDRTLASCSFQWCRYNKDGIPKSVFPILLNFLTENSDLWKMLPKFGNFCSTKYCSSAEIFYYLWINFIFY